MLNILINTLSFYEVLIHKSHKTSVSKANCSVVFVPCRPRSGQTMDGMQFMQVTGSPQALRSRCLGDSSPEGPPSASGWRVAAVVARSWGEASSPWSEPTPWKTAICGADARSVCSLGSHLRTGGGEMNRTHLTCLTKLRFIKLFTPHY